MTHLDSNRIVQTCCKPSWRAQDSTNSIELENRCAARLRGVESVSLRQHILHPARFLCVISMRDNVSYRTHKTVIQSDKPGKCSGLENR